MWVRDLLKLKKMNKEDYNKLLKSGMFWEWYPEATGNYKEDTSIKPIPHFRNEVKGRAEKK